ncbi:MAG: carbohydrate-binding domain-containing protein [Bacteroidales bacterium]|nr:carbohydrate-binding domain-containing protein [Bacteroidales bacterium]
MKAISIIRTVVGLSVSLIPLSCAGDEILLTEEEAGSGTETTTQTDPNLSWSASTFEATLGADNSYPTLTNKYGVAVSYTSSNTDVAKITSDGSITLVAAGTSTITASSSETDEYSASSTAYTLTVVKNAEGISWSADTCSVTIGAENTFPTLSNPGKQEVTYTSSNENVAKISSEGEITLVAAGTTTITAASEGNDTYEGSSVFYTLEVIGDDSTKSAGLSWSVTSCTATLASENEFPSLSNPNGLDVEYSSSNTAVASVSEDGAVSLISEGTVTISVTSEATEEYSAGSASYTLKVVKCSVTVEWSENSLTAVLEDSNSYPELTVSPEIVGKSISYTSSNTGVATIDTEGNITLIGVGTSTISATFAGDDTYKAASASYTLVVTSGADDGAGSFSYSSTGDPTSEDDISNTTFSRMITVTYSGSSASVTGDYYGYVSTSGANVTVKNTGTENIIYKLTGTSTNGSFKLYSSKKQAILLSGLTLTNPSGAAINNQSGKRTFVIVEGSSTLADGSSAAYTTSDDEDMKAVIFSEGQLVFSGSGSLTVNAANKQGKSAIVSDDYVRIMGSPYITVFSGSSAGHGIRGKEYVQISDGTISVTTTAAMKKGIGSDDYVLVEGGESTINVSGGVAYDSDDAEYKGTAGIKADNYFAMTGGKVTIKNTGAGGKGISAGSYDYDETSHKLSDSYISGGTLSITTTGSESNDVSSKGIKIGYKEKSGNKYVYGGNLVISGGKIVVSVSKSEGVEAKGNMTFNGGETYVTSSADDAINCQGELNVNNGYIYAFSSQNDAMDSNGNMKFNGGYVFAVTTKGSPEVAIDANTEGGYKLYINSGATVVAYGGLENGYSASQTVYSMSCTAGSWNALSDGSGYTAAFKVPSGVSTVAVSAPNLKSAYKGVSVSGTTLCNGIWATSGISGGSTSSLSTYSGGMGGGGMGGPGGGWGPGRGW